MSALAAQVRAIRLLRINVGGYFTMQGFAQMRTVLASFDNPEFRCRLERLADQQHWEIWWSDCDTDIIAVPWFVAIIDRQVLGADAWTAYEEFCRETGETDPVILIDDGQFSNLATQQIPLGSQASLEFVLQILSDIHLAVMNKRLENLYRERLTNFYATLSCYPGLSAPLLLFAPDAYESIKKKILVVGQQTCDWGAFSSSIEELLALYRNFDLAQNYGPSPFWQAAHDLYKSINPSGPERGFLWSNLVKVDMEWKRPTPEVEELVCGLGLLQDEIMITRPNAVVFFTGPTYDDRLKQTFREVRFTEISEYVSKLTHHLLPEHAYRTYHPKFLFLKNKRDVIEQIAQQIRGEP